MKKLMIGVLSLACLSCMAAAVTMQANRVSADEQVGTSIFTETKCQISKTGDRMLMVTGITDVSKIYEMGYEISGGYQVQEGDVAETNMYYESLTLGGSTKTASEFIEGAEGLLIWEIDYNCDYTYTVQAYAYEGVFNQSGQLTIPEVEEKTYGIKKESFNLVTVTFVDEEGATIDTQSVAIGGNATSIEAPNKADAQFDGWYMDGEKYDFGAAVKKNITLTAKYKYAVNYTVKVEAPKYNVKYVSGYYYANTLSYVDATSDYASYLGLNADGVATAMAGTEVDLTKTVASLPAGVKVSESSVLKGVVAEDGSLELSVKLDFDEEYLGFKISQVYLGQWGNCDDAIMSLAIKSGVVGLAIDSTIGNGSGVYIDIDDVDKTVTPSLVLNYFEQNNSDTRIEAQNEAGTWSSPANLFSKTPTEDNYFGTSLDLFEKFPTYTKITNVKIKALGGGTKHMFIVGLNANGYAPNKNVQYTMDNGKLAGIVKPLAMGTVGEEMHSFGSGTMNSFVYNFAGKEPGTQCFKVGVSLDLGGAIQVSNYKSINVLFQTTSQKVSDDTYNAGTWVFINGVNATPGGDGHTTTYYNGVHTADLIKLAKEMNIETIKTVEIAHAIWGDRKNITMYIGSVSLTLADGVEEDDATPAVSVTYSADNGNIMDIATAMNGVTLTTEKNYEVGGTLYNNLCYRYTDVVSGPDEFPGERVVGVKFNLGEVNVKKYETIKIKFRVTATKEDGSNNANWIVYINGIKVNSGYAGPQEIDLKALAESNGIAKIETIEISNSNWVNIANYNVFVSFIELVAAN